MTLKEAAEFLKDTSPKYFNAQEAIAHAVKKEEVRKLAIRSLEAWEKVRDEIKRMPTGFLPDMQSVYADITKQRCLQIINRYLSEVENKRNENRMENE